MKLLVARLLLATLTLAEMRVGEVAFTPGRKAGRTAFMVHDNMFYRGKPNTIAAGLVVANNIYENKIWPNKRGFGRLPNRGAFKALVRSHMDNPGPLVIDIEKTTTEGARRAPREPPICIVFE